MLPKFSLIAPAIREHNYKKIYKHLRNDNDAKFEMVFVGDKPPRKKISSKFRYIYTEVGLPQCVEIAAREARGEYLICITDDIDFSPHFLDKIDSYLIRLHMDKMLIGNRFKSFGEFQNESMFFDVNIDNSPVISFAPVYKKNLWHKFGGIDRRFKFGFHYIDLMMRFYEEGHNLFIIPDSWCNEFKDKKISNGKFKKNKHYGRKFCNRLWVEDGEVVENRLLPVESFDDKDILTKDQFVEYKYF